MQHSRKQFNQAVHACKKRLLKPSQEAAIGRLELFRKILLSSELPLHTLVRKNKYDAGEEDWARSQTAAPLGKIVKRAAKNKKWARFLFTFSAHFKPANILELGTCVGLSASFLAAATPQATRIHTLEGSPDFTATAEELLRILGYEKKVVCHNGIFRDILLDILEEYAPFDLAFVDGHHSGPETVKYFQEIKPYLARQAVMIFDDIRWSDGMLKAWEQTITDSDIVETHDMKDIGLCYIER